MLQYVGHLLLRVYCGRHERKAENVFNHAHIIEQSFYTGRIPIHEEQTVEFGEAMVNLACHLVFSIEFQTNHFGELGRESIADNTIGDAFCVFIKEL